MHAVIVNAVRASAAWAAFDALVRKRDKFFGGEFEVFRHDLDAFNSHFGGSGIGWRFTFDSSAR